MPEETPPRCEICGAPYLEIGEEVRRFLPEALREQIRFRPSCDCLERKKQEEVLEEIARKQREARQQEIEELFQRARLSKRFRRCTLQSFVPMDQKQEQALSVFSEFAERFSEFKEREINGLYLFGLPARGKTHLAAALVNELVPRGVCCIYQKSTQLLAKFFEAVYDKKPQSVLLRPLSEAELLVLDDLGAEEGHQFMSARLYEILDYRMEWMLPTVITSNLSLAQVDARYGARVASRIERMCRILEI